VSYHFSERALKGLNGSDSAHLIILPYSDQLEWERASELAISLKNQKKNVVIVSYKIFDIRGMKRILQFLTGYRYINPKLHLELKIQGVKLLSLHAFLPAYFFIGRNRGSLRIKNIGKLIEYVYPHVSDTLKTTQVTIAVRSHRKEIKKEIKNFIVTQKLNSMIYRGIKPENISCVYTVNGRYSRNRAVKEYFTARNLSVKIIENGKPGSFILWDNAQSMRELQEVSDVMWREADKGVREFIAVSHMEKRVDSKDGDNSRWTRMMQTGNPLNIPKGKKICVFYSTTEIEFAFLGDKVPLGEFQKQTEALEALVNKLGSSWQVILRRHPHASSGVDSGEYESELWESMANYKEIVVIPGNSSVDSYELGLQADLIAHFGSSIGADFIFLNRVPVISLGPSEWDLFDEVGKVRTSNQIEEYLKNGPKIVHRQTILPWAYFYATRGTDYQLLKQNSIAEWTIDGEPLHLPFKNWSIARLGTFRSKIKGLKHSANLKRGN
jgi:hypothetical protein